MTISGLDAALSMTPAAQTATPGVRRGYGVNYSEVNKQHENVVKIMPGGYFVGHGCRRIETSLGSCVAACIRDPYAGVGGMNHFMLPQNSGAHDNWLSCERTRYGVHAMETLINAIIKRGGERQHFEVKLFGGGHVVNQMKTDIGQLNIAFVRLFLKTEGLAISAEDLGGLCSRRLIYDINTGEVLLKHSVNSPRELVQQRDQAHLKRISQTPAWGEIELFES
ncbi:MAG: chemoreceptor glutamine deamidase CheD [Motiliproteus sp.]